jgi:hypothetical protein
MKRQKKSVPDHKLDSDLHEAFSTAVAKPLGEVREIIALPDPRKAELANIESFVVRNEERHVAPGMTALVKREARKRLNAGQYRNTVRDVLLGFIEDETLSVNKRISAAACLSKFLPKESKIEIHHEETVVDVEAIEARQLARRRIADALLALQAPK